MSASRNDSGAAQYATVANRFLFSMFESMISMMFINLLMTRSHVHFSDVINMTLIFFRIKLVLNLPKFLILV